MIGKRVQVTSGPDRGRRFICTPPINGVYWADIHDEVRGFTVDQLRPIGWARRLVRRALGRG